MNNLYSKLYSYLNIGTNLFRNLIMDIIITALSVPLKYQNYAFITNFIAEEFQYNLSRIPPWSFSPA